MKDVEAAVAPRRDCGLLHLWGDPPVRILRASLRLSRDLSWRRSAPEADGVDMLVGTDMAGLDDCRSGKQKSRCDCNGF
jgi:hypothetical protein